MKNEYACKRVDSLKNAVCLMKNSDGHLCYARIDKMSWVTDLGREQNKVLLERISKLKSSGGYLIKCRPAGKKECGDLYRSVVEIRFADKRSAHPVLMMIYFSPTRKICGVMRVEFSPQHYTPVQISDLFLWLGRKERLGKYLYRALRSAWVTTIHYALDVVGMQFHDYLFGLKNKHGGEYYDLHGPEEGLRLGSSTLIASVYAKVNAPVSTEERYSAPLLTLEESQLEHFLRLELRFSPGKQKLMLRNLSHMTNLVSRLVIYRREMLEDKGLDPDFVKLLGEMPIPAARAKFKPASKLNGKVVSATKDAANKRVDKRMKKYRVALFDAETIWGQLPLVLAKLGILAQPQYWGYGNRQKWLKSREK
ncbi:hypothetical protein [Klebsiella michiganensis]|uniref:hypothetical protein n=1 Tax=Klebsiella michiganensis TaxID=1134687 RepID=UPI003F8955B4